MVIIICLWLLFAGYELAGLGEESNTDGYELAGVGGESDTDGYELAGVGGESNTDRYELAVAGVGGDSNTDGYELAEAGAEYSNTHCMIQNGATSRVESSFCYRLPAP